MPYMRLWSIIISRGTAHSLKVLYTLQGQRKAGKHGEQFPANEQGSTEFSRKFDNTPDVYCNLQAPCGSRETLLAQIPKPRTLTCLNLQSASRNTP